MTKILFLDLDGTIREPITGKFIDSPINQRLIEGANKAMEFYKNQGWVLIGITNQGGVEAGYKSFDNCIVEQNQTLYEARQIDSIFFCPDFKGRKCIQVTRKEIFKYSFDEEPDYQTVHNPKNVFSFRKPGTGMFKLAIEKLTQIPAYQFIDSTWFLEDSECWMIGDRPEDKEAADNLGVNYIAADVWRSRFLPGIHEFDLSPREIQFLEGIKLI